MYINPFDVYQKSEKLNSFLIGKLCEFGERK